LLTVLVLAFFLVNAGTVFALSCETEVYGDLYLTEDLICGPDDYYALEIDAHNVVIDCQGHTIQGVDRDPSYGIYFYGIYDGATVRNCVIKGFYTGIQISDSSYNEFYNNTLEDNYFGVWVWSGKGKSDAHDNVFWNNKFMNRWPEGGDNVWEYDITTNYWYKDDIGNYWDNFDIPDDHPSGYGWWIYPGYPHYYQVFVCGNPDLHPNPTFCGDVLQRNEFWADGIIVLTRDLNCEGTALTIGEDDITLNCNGHTIKGDGTGIGIDINDKFNVSVHNCYIENFETGVYVNNSDLVSIGKYIYTGKPGPPWTDVPITEDYAGEPIASKIFNNKWGILVDGSSSNVDISNNEIRHNKKLGSRPKPPMAKKGTGGGKNHPFQATALAVVPVVPYLGGGILIGEASSVNITYNNLTSNNHGVKILEGSTDNLIHHNNFRNYNGLWDTKNAFDANTGQVNTWDDNISEGNYWNDYSGTGVYEIPGGDSVDNYPQTNPI